MASGDIIRLGVYTGTDSFFGWAGAGFPYAGDEDIIVSENTVWDDACGYKKCKKLTINAGVTLKIAQSPFYIFCDELGGGVIDASGASGSASLIAHPSYLAKGAEYITGVAPYAQGGCGGGLILVCARLISGTVTIVANGGNGWSGPETASSKLGYAGQGAYSMCLMASNNFPGAYDGSTSPASNGYNFLHPLGIFCGRGGSVNGGRGGGHGNSVNGTTSGGGSGIGGGGAGSGESGNQPLRSLTPYHVLQLALHGFLGGGGGGIQRDTTADNNGAGGGGGGGIVVWYKDKTATPILQANGGLGSGVGGNGASGATFMVSV